MKDAEDSTKKPMRQDWIREFETLSTWWWPMWLLVVAVLLVALYC